MDLAYLERLCKGNRDRMEEFITLYLSESKALFTTLGSSMAGRDLEVLASTAHGLRPHVLYMDATELHNKLQALERQAHLQDAAACSNLTMECIRLQEELVALLTNWLRNGSTAKNG